MLVGCHVKHTCCCSLAAQKITLDFAGMTAVIAQKQGSVLQMDNLVIRGFASKHLPDRNPPLNYSVPDLGPWPSIVADPGASVSMCYELLR